METIPSCLTGLDPAAITLPLPTCPRCGTALAPGTVRYNGSRLYYQDCAACALALLAADGQVLGNRLLTVYGIDGPSQACLVLYDTPSPAPS